MYEDTELFGLTMDGSHEANSCKKYQRSGAKEITCVTGVSKDCTWLLRQEKGLLKAAW